MKTTLPPRPASAIAAASPLKAAVVFLILSTIWGSTWLFIKIGLRDLPPFTFAGIRFVIAAGVLYAMIFLRSIPLPRSRADWTLIGLTGVLTFGVNYGLLFWGEARVSSGLAALLQATIPAFGLVIAHAYLPEEPLTWARVGGVAMGLVGVAVIFSDQLTGVGPRALWGSAAIVVGAASVAYANVLIKARAQHLHPAAMAAGQMSFGLAPLLAAGLLLEGNPLRLHWTASAVGCLLYLAVAGSSVAFLLAYWLVRRIAVTKMMLISLVTPVAAVVLGWLALGETLSLRALAGGACVIGGIALIVVRRRG